jgi:hypothetical protein
MTMERRELLKTVAMTGAAAGLGLLAGASPGSAAVTDSSGVGVVDIAPPDPAYHIPGRFAGKTMIVTGCARGMGAGVAVRAAREGAQIVDSP